MTKSVSSAQEKYSIDAFFAGVGGIELGFTQTGKFRVNYANEFDKNARITYKLNNPETNLDGRDIHEVSPEELPKCTVMMGGFPCQAFSIAGYRKGFEDDRGDLFFEMLKMIKAKEPEVVFIENVKNLVTHDHGNTFKVIREALASNGYYLKWQVLNSKDFGNIPQNRERIYLLGFKNKEVYDDFSFPNAIELKTELKDVIHFGDEVDDRYYYKKGRQPFYDQLEEEITSQDTVYQWRRQYVRANKSGVVPTLTANMGTGGHNVPLILTDDKKIRKLTPKETFNVQGFPKEFKLPDDVSNGQLYKQAGNSVSVPVINRIAERVLSSLEKHEDAKIDNSTSDGNFVIVYLDVTGKFKGESYVINRFSTMEDAVKYAQDNKLKVVSDKEYLKLIEKKRNDSFYMIEEIS